MAQMGDVSLQGSLPGSIRPKDLSARELLLSKRKCYKKQQILRSCYGTKHQCNVSVALI